MRNTGLILALLAIGLVMSSPCYAQWARTYGGSGEDDTQSIQPTSDGGYIVAGQTTSFDASGYDFWVLKLQPDGTVAWEKTYGGPADDQPACVQQTSDGGYIVLGYTSSHGAGSSDIWVLSLDSNGNVGTPENPIPGTWQKTYGGEDIELCNSIQETTDGGYIIAGRTRSFGQGDFDVWILKIDAYGNVLWQKTYGGTDYDGAVCVEQTSNGGYIVAAYTVSYGPGANDIWPKVRGQVLYYNVTRSWLLLFCLQSSNEAPNVSLSRTACIRIQYAQPE